jgi:hypothetical protein
MWIPFNGYWNIYECVSETVLRNINLRDGRVQQGRKEFY